ncbi:MAG: metallophosphoesterase family protein [Nanoarchaeota archaeon]
MTKIRFAHLADLHLGSWRERILTELNFKTFEKAIDKVIEEKVDFAVFAGDIFNSPMPPIEILNRTVQQLMRLKSANVPLYVIGGSHDYSTTGKSFITLLETAGVFTDVCKLKQTDKETYELKLTRDEKTGTMIGGVLGRKNSLEKRFFENLNVEKKEAPFKILMFHTGMGDFKPESMKNVNFPNSLKLLPKGFDYYAGGHIHEFMKTQVGNSLISYTGCLFPNNFYELKSQECSFNLLEFETETKKLDLKRIILKTYEKEVLKVDVTKLNPLQAKEKIISEIEKLELENKIFLLEISGVLEGKISDIGLGEIVSMSHNLGAIVVLKNTHKLTSSILEQDMDKQNLDTEELEEIVTSDLLENEENRDKLEPIFQELLNIDFSKREEERNIDYETRIIETFQQVLNITKD